MTRYRALVALLRRLADRLEAGRPVRGPEEPVCDAPRRRPRDAHTGGYTGSTPAESVPPPQPTPSETIRPRRHGELR